jgi:hypothetical protein
VSANGEMMRGLLDRDIAHAETSVEKWSIRASTLVPSGDQAKRARCQLGPVLTGQS